MRTGIKNYQNLQKKLLKTKFILHVKKMSKIIKNFLKSWQQHEKNKIFIKILLKMCKYVENVENFEGTKQKGVQKSNIVFEKLIKKTIEKYENSF